MARLPAAAFAVVVLVAALAFATPALAANYELEIDAPDELVAPLRERTLLGRWLAEPGFDRDQLPLFVERAKDEAAAIVRAAGYFSGRVTVSLDEPRAGGLPRVRIAVDAGARTTVNRFELAVDGPSPAQSMREALVARWPLPEGSFFRTAEWEQGKRLLLDILQQHGFVRARIVESRAEVDPRLTAASLSLRIDTGPQLAFGPTTIRGLERYDRSIVEALVPWTAAEGERGAGGDPYSFDQLLVLQARLRASGYFDGVSVLPDLAAVEADPARTTVPVRVDLTERKTQRAMFGIGYSSDEGARGLLGYEHRDLFDRGWQLESGVLWQSVRRRVFASVRTPQQASGHYYQAGARVERFDVQGELTDKRTLFVGQGKHAEDTEIFVSLQYQLEQRTLPLAPADDGRRALTLGYAWNRRRLDSPIDPRSGYSISAQLSGAARGLGSDRSFARLYTRMMRFWPIPRQSPLGDGLLVGLVEAGYVLATSRQDIPSENLFRTGGTQSIRGYEYLSLGVPEAGAIVGGRVLALASLEYQHPIAPNWYGAAFVDVGDAADRWVDYRAVWGYGAGVRWRSPIGPVNLDLAYGEAVKRWRLHLSVGYAF
ncbi:MAG: autotransporter assembly complex protein TamA [Burkholderiaceae bacterium]|nr:autotransporter assembly complex protein TamA [Burkholderiaceae bacterium]